MPGGELPNSANFFESLYTNSDYRNLVRAVGYKTLGGSFNFLLEDVCQETWRKVWEAYEKETFQEIRDHRPWLATIARYTSLDHIRQQSFYDLDYFPKFEEKLYTIHSNDSRIDIERTYQRLIVLLPKHGMYQRLREVLKHVVQGKRVKEIAEILNIAESIISKDVRRLGRIIGRIEQTYTNLVSNLSELQQQILRYAIDGKQGKEIAQLLGISPS